MKATELQLNDWVRVTDDDTTEAFVGRVTALDLELGNVSVKRKGEETAYPFSVDCIEGIPVAPEILGKNFRGYKRGSGALANFVYELNEEYFIRASAGSVDFCTHYDDSEHAAHDDIYLVELCYVHTLQHALRLYGIEKEIVL